MAYKTYNHFHVRPFAQIEQSLKIATDVIGLSIDRILKYPYVVAVDPLNSRKILDDFTCFDGIDPKEMISISPGIIRTNYLNILKITSILKNFEVPIHKWKKACLIYTLKPETVEQRLLDAKKNNILKSLYYNPKYLLLILYKKKVDKRINILEKANKKCQSTTILLLNESLFQNVLKSDNDKNRRKDILYLLTQLFSIDVDLQQKRAENMMKLLEKHPRWLYIPNTSLEKTLNLLRKYFSNEDIINNPYLILYSKEIIEKHILFIKNLQIQLSNEKNNNNEKPNIDDIKYITKLQNFNTYLNLNFSRITNSQILSLILYLIEKEHCFSGDGIWNNKILI